MQDYGLNLQISTKLFDIAIIHYFTKKKFCNYQIEKMRQFTIQAFTI